MSVPNMFEEGRNAAERVRAEREGREPDYAANRPYVGDLPGQPENQRIIEPDSDFNPENPPNEEVDLDFNPEIPVFPPANDGGQSGTAATPEEAP